MSGTEYSLESELALGRLLSAFGRLRELNPVQFCQSQYGLRLRLWPEQRVVLKIIYNIGLTAPEMRILKKWEKLRDKGWSVHLPEIAEDVKTAVWMLGMRSSKTFMAAAVGCYETYRYLMKIDPWEHYNIDHMSPVFGIVAATSKEVARDTVYAHLKNFVTRCWIFQHFGAEPRASEIRFPSHNFMIKTGAANSSTIRGKTDLFVIYDELDWMPDSKGRMGGREVYTGLSRGTKTLDGLNLAISSPSYEDSQMCELLKDSERIGSMFGLNLATWQFNPNEPYAKFKDDLRRNRILAMRDFGARPSTALSPFFPKSEAVEACVDHDNPVDEAGEEVLDFNISPEDFFIGAFDQSFKHDRMGIALGHAQDDELWIDLSLALTPSESELEIQEPRAYNLLIDLQEDANVDTWMYDNFMYIRTIQELEAYAEVKQRHTLYPQYKVLKGLINSQKIHLPRHELLIDELCGLELMRGHPKHRVDHRTGFSKDCADCVCNIAYEWAVNEGMLEHEVALPTGR